MPRMSLIELNNYLARHPATGTPPDDTDADAVEPGQEVAVLHTAILQELHRRGWDYDYDPPHRAGTGKPGKPDFTIWADGGRYFLVEAKTITGRLSKAQKATKAKRERLGHTVHVVRSLARFLEVVG